MTIRTLCLSFLLLAAACDGGAECSAGETQICSCGSLSGTQTCGSDGTFGICECAIADGGTDASSSPDSSTPPDSGPDASARPDAGQADGGDGCDFTGFSPVQSSADVDVDNDPPTWLSLNITSSHESMYVDLLFSDGAQDTPHTHTFTGENYHDCSECLLMYAECPTPDSPDCATAYLAVSGTMTFSALTRTSLAGTIDNVRMIEVTIDQNLDGTLFSTPVADGRTWCIPSLSFP